jgi:MFS family permease
MRAWWMGGVVRVLTSRASFWTAAAVAALALWTSAAPIVSYPLYATTWHLTPTVTSIVFAVYPIVLVIVLVLFGDLADHIGRRSSILLGLAAELLGTLAFVFAQDVTWILVGRAFMGIGVGLSLSPASAAMVEFSAAGRSKRAGSVTTAVTAVGIALAMLVGGALVQYAPLPLRLNYVVLAIAIVGALVASWFLPRHTPAETATRWRPRPITVPRGQRWVFAAAAASMMSSFLLGTVVLSLGAQIARELAGSENALVTGALLSVFAFAIAAAAVTFARVPVRVVIVLGTLFAISGIGLYVLTGASHSLALFFAASAVAGVGYSLTFMGGITLVNSRARTHHRAGMLSALYLVGYVSQGLAAPALGALATAYGLGTALDIAAPLMSIVFLGAGVLAIATRGSSPSTATAPVPVA